MVRSDLEFLARWEIRATKMGFCKLFRTCSGPVWNFTDLTVDAVGWFPRLRGCVDSSVFWPIRSDLKYRADWDVRAIKMGFCKYWGTRANPFWWFTGLTTGEGEWFSLSGVWEENNVFWVIGSEVEFLVFWEVKATKMGLWKYLRTRSGSFWCFEVSVIANVG